MAKTMRGRMLIYTCTHIESGVMHMLIHMQLNMKQSDSYMTETSKRSARHIYMTRLSKISWKYAYIWMYGGINHDRIHYIYIYISIYNRVQKVAVIVTVAVQLYIYIYIWAKAWLIDTHDARDDMAVIYGSNTNNEFIHVCRGSKSIQACKCYIWSINIATYVKELR